MTKRKVSVVLLACLAVLTVLLMALPMAASAAITTVKWATPVFQGTDTYYGTGVVAYKAGTTAQVTVQVYNDQGVDVTIREAKIIMDWGAVHAATVAPTQLKKDETGSFTFDVPIPATASNTVLHNYQVAVGFQKQDTGYKTFYQAGEKIGTGNGAQLQFSVLPANRPILASSLKVYWRDTTAPPPDTITPKDASTYTVDAYLGMITFGAAPPALTDIYVDYQYFQSLGSGDGVKTVFFTGSSPVADGSLQVYVANTATMTFAAAAVSTTDLDTGKITLASAPASYETVYATYESWTRWPLAPGLTLTPLAVYTADQGDAMVSSQQYTSMSANYPAYLFTPGTAAAKAQEEAAVLAAKAGVEYKNGDFANAKADYGTAVTSLQAAIDSDSTLNTTAETALLGLLSRGDNVVDAYAAKLNGQATMSKNIGVFYIMLGVATLLAGIGGIIWAFSQVIHARGPRQQI